MILKTSLILFIRNEFDVDLIDAVEFFRGLIRVGRAE